MTLLCSVSALSTVAVLCIALDTELSPRIYFGGLSWFSVEHANVAWDIYLDAFTLTMLTAVSIVGTFVAIYSYWYMSSDPGVLRFTSLVLLFVGFISVLVAAKTLVLLFLGWEGIGVVSFLLISFWQTRALSAQASIQAFLLNRAGDMLLALALITFLLSTGAWGLIWIPEMAKMGDTPYLTTGVCLLLGGAIGKSAQVGFHAWLPNAIEAPTPVSALIHAATLITAGVYLVSRLSVCLIETEGALYVCFIGASSLLFAGLIGLTQTDFKRVVAFSTISQVGYIILGCGVGAFQASVFMLFTHAFYKALLFLGAGAVIHATANIQDTRSMGGLGSYVPVTKALFIAASLSLGASPFSSGDFSKDVLIELMSCTQFASKNIFWIVAVAGAGLTTAYSGRLIRLVFAAEQRGPTPSLHHDLPLYLASILTMLAVFSVAGGYIVATIYELGHLSSFANTPDTSAACAVEYQTRILTLNLPLICSIMGLITGIGGITFFISGRSHNQSFWNVMSLTQGGWDNTFPRHLIKSTLILTARIQKYQDAGLLEITGPSGLTSLFYRSNYTISPHWLHTYVKYAVTIVVLVAATG